MIKQTRRVFDVLAGMLASISIFNLIVGTFSIGLSGTIGAIARTYVELVHNQIFGRILDIFNITIDGWLIDVIVLNAVLAGIAVRTRFAHDKIYQSFDQDTDVALKRAKQDLERADLLSLELRLDEQITPSTQNSSPIQKLIRACGISLIWPLIIYQTLYYEKLSSRVDRASKRKEEAAQALQPPKSLRYYALNLERREITSEIGESKSQALDLLKALSRDLKRSLLLQISIVLCAVILLLATNAGLQSFDSTAAVTK